MAASPAAPKITVRRRPAVLVAPAAPTPRELKRLSDIDDQQGLRLHVPVILFYRRNESMSGKDPARVVRDAIAKALVHYYPFAGRVRDHDGGKLAVDCTAEGVLFIEADADARLEHYGDPLLPPFPCLDELIFDVPGSSAITNTPLLTFQVTRLACGGFILAVRLNHTMADAQGLTQFLGAVAELARGAQAPSVQPVWQRELLEGRSPPPQASPPPPLGNNEVDKAPAPPLMHGEVLQLRSLFFGRREIAAIRAQLSPRLQKHATKFDAVAGWLWKFRTAALAPGPDEVMELMVIVNARGRRSTSAGVGIPVGYYGNAFAVQLPTSTAGELCRNPVSYAVELVRKAKSEVDMEYMRSTADLLALRRGQSPIITAGTYCLSDETNVGFEFDNLDFGWGKPAYAGPAEAVGVPSLPWMTSFLLPFKNADGEDSIVVPICLPGPAMERLVEEMGKLQQTHALIPSQEVSALNNSLWCQRRPNAE